MALADILAAIRRETEDEIARVRAVAADDIAAIEAEADAAVAAAQEEAAHGRDQAAQANADRIRNRALLAADRRLREAEEQVFQRALDQVRARLQDLTSTGRYRLVMETLVAESREMLPNAAILRVAPEDAELAGSLAAPFGNWIVEPSLDGGRGVELATNDGRLVRNTLEDRVARAEPHLRRLLAQQVLERGAAS